MSYARNAISVQVAQLLRERDQLIVTQRELKDSVAETLGYITDALTQLETARLALHSQDDRDAIATIMAQGAEFNARRVEVERDRDDLASRDFDAEIAEMDRKILSLQASLGKLPEEINETKVH